jgi:hypothetical protein
MMTRKRQVINNPVLQSEELARFQVMQLIEAQRLDGRAVFKAREAGISWSKIRDAGRAQRHGGGRRSGRV